MGRYTRFILFAVAFGMLSMAWTAAHAQQMTITDGPRIEDVSATSAEIAWTTSTGGSSVIHYGTDPNNLNQTAESPYVQGRAGNGHATHRVRIPNLQPNTTYYFVVDSGQGQGNGGEIKSQVGQFQTSGSGSSDKVPLYRAFSPTGAHLFTTSYQEYQNVISQNGYKDEGVAGYIARKQAAGTEPFYRLFNASTNDHLYTADATEKQNQLASGNYKDEGVAGYIATSQQSGTSPLYRLINGSNQHFYTADASERQRDLQQGWKDEGVAGYIWQH